jgi:hypothetical protein
MFRVQKQEKKKFPNTHKHRDNTTLAMNTNGNYNFRYRYSLFGWNNSIMQAQEEKPPFLDEEQALAFYTNLLSSQESFNDYIQQNGKRFRSILIYHPPPSLPLSSTNATSVEPNEMDEKDETLRIQLWSCCTQSLFYHTNDHYIQLYEKLKNHNHSENQNDTGNLNAISSSCKYQISFTEKIKKDIHRTFPHLAYFKEKEGPGQSQLFSILKAYAIFDSQVGYVQGMAFIAGFILYHTRDENRAFWIFVQLLNEDKFGLKDLFRHGLPRLKLLLYCIDRIMQQLLPDVHKHLTDECISPEMYAANFILTLCTTRFRINVVRRIWDLFLYESWIVLIRLIIGLFHIFSARVLKLHGSDIVSFIYERCNRLNEQSLMHDILLNADEMVTESLFLKCRAEYKQQLPVKQQEIIEKQKRNREQVLKSYQQQRQQQEQEGRDNILNSIMQKFSFPFLSKLKPSNLSEIETIEQKESKDTNHATDKQIHSNNNIINDNNHAKLEDMDSDQKK